VALTAPERMAGRSFRAERQGLLAALNLEDPPGLLCSPWSPPWVRHVCTVPGGTQALKLRELHADSPQYLVTSEQAVLRDAPGQAPGLGLVSVVRAALFRYCWFQGTCRHCGLVARSSSGRIEVRE
jgi:hypothetical protein